MDVVLWTYGARDDVTPMPGLAAQLRILGVEVRVREPQKCAALRGKVGGPPVLIGVSR